MVCNVMYVPRKVLGIMLKENSVMTSPPSICFMVESYTNRIQVPLSIFKIVAVAINLDP